MLECDKPIQSWEASIEALTQVNAALPKEIKAIFIGGATIPLHDEKNNVEKYFRPTKDIDVLPDTELDFYDSESLLRKSGFKDLHEPPITSFLFKDIPVDFIFPSGEQGFSNEWLIPAVKSAVPYTLPNGSTIHIPLLENLLALKIAAAKSRGMKEGKSIHDSHDIEDIFTLLSSRKDVSDLIGRGSDELRGFLASYFKELMDLGDFEDLVLGQISYLESEELYDEIIQFFKDYIKAELGESNAEL